MNNLPKENIGAQITHGMGWKDDRKQATGRSSGHGTYWLQQQW